MSSYDGQQCEVCGNEIFNHRRKRRRFCSMDCRNISFAGNGNPFYGRKHTVGSVLLRMRKPRKPSDKFRGLKTPEARQNMRKNHADVCGENNPNWQGGITGERHMNYPRKYYTARKLVYLRDEGLCQDCGEEGTHCHHIDGNINHNSPRNLVMQCRGCHFLKHWQPTLRRHAA